MSRTVCVVASVLRAAAGCTCHERHPLIVFGARALVLAALATATAVMVWAGRGFLNETLGSLTRGC